MSDVLTALRTHLLTKSAITDLASTRVYFDELPQGATLPAIVLSLISSESQRHLGGHASLGRVRIQADSYAATRAAATNLGEQVRIATDDQTNTSWGSETIRHGLLLDQRDTIDVPIEGSGESRRVRSADYAVWFVESSPST